MPSQARPLAAFCTLLSPFVPLLFMGEEYGEPSPFQFFSDHIDEEIAQATREGRRREFAAFAEFAEEIPDPQAVATLERSKLSREADPELAELYRRLISLRSRLPRGDAAPIAFDEEGRWLRVGRGDYELVCNFGAEAALLPLAAGARIELATDPATEIVGAGSGTGRAPGAASASHLRIAPQSGALLGSGSPGTRQS